MNVDLTDDELAFQQTVRRFFAEQYPDDLRAKLDAGAPLTRDDTIRWQKILFRQGWAAVNWPVEYGGTGWSAIQKYLYYGEMAAANAPDMIPFGVKMVGPVIYYYGNEEQKARFLPDILESNVW
jgi:alkylation response protein AidB-like acyl-CoA dehydrogenase